MPIFKYTPDFDHLGPGPDAVVVIPMQEGARILSIGAQGSSYPSGHPGLDDVRVWAVVGHKAPPLDVRIYVVGTGHDVPHWAGSFLGTIVLDSGSLVLHFFLDRQQEDAGLVQKRP